MTSSVRDLDLRGGVPYTRHKLDFALAQSDVAIANQRHPDKDLLCATIMELREQGMSYREIAQTVRLHWTRIQQIVKSDDRDSY